MWLCIGSTLGVAFLIWACVRFSDSNAATNCMACGRLYLPSESTAEKKYIFCRGLCESLWKSRN
jgi:hypothetical protein